MQKNRWKKIIPKIGKVILVTLFSLFLLLIIVSISLFLPPVQKWITNIANNQLEKVFSTQAQVGTIRLLPPSTLIVKDIYIKGPDVDTMAFVGRAEVTVTLAALAAGTISLSDIDLRNVKGHLRTAPNDTTLNLVKALKNNKKQEQPKDTTKQNKEGGLEISLGDIEISDVDFKFNNLNDSMLLDVLAKSIKLEVDDFAPDENIYSLKSSSLNGAHVSLKMKPSEETDTSSSESELHIGLAKSLRLQNSSFYYENLADGSFMDLNNINMVVDPEQISLPEQTINIENFKLADFNFVYNPPQNNVEKPAGEENDTSAFFLAEFPWSIVVQRLELENNSIKLNNMLQGSSFSSDDLTISHLSLLIHQLELKKDHLVTALHSLSLYASPLNMPINQLQFNVSIKPNALDLNNLHLATRFSNIQTNLSVQYDSFDELTNKALNEFINLDINNTWISTNDINNILTAFQPGSEKPFPDGEKIYLMADANGSASKMNINHLSISTKKGSVLHATGQIQQLLSLEQMQLNLMIDTLAVLKDDIMRFTSDTIFPKNMNLPKVVSASAQLKGSMELLKAKLNVYSDVGNLQFNGSMHASNNFSNLVFGGEISTSTWDIDSILQQQTLQKIALKGSFNGVIKDSSLNFASYTGTFPTLKINNYTYQPPLLDMEYRFDSINAWLSINDTNLIADAEAHLLLDDSIPNVEASLSLKAINTKALNFTNELYKASGKLTADFQGRTLSNINGNAKINSVYIVNNGQQYEIDSIVLEAENKENYTFLQLDAPFVEANYKGSLKPQDLANELKNHLGNYFLLEDEALEEINLPKQYELEVQVKPHPLLTQLLLPQVSLSKPIKITSTYNSADFKLNAHLSVPQFSFGDIQTDSIQVFLESDENKIFLNIGTGTVQSGFLYIDELELWADASNNKMNIGFLIDSQSDDPLYSIRSTMQSINDSILITIRQDSLILNKKDYTVSADNQIVMQNKSFSVQNLRLQHKDKELLISTRSDGNKADDEVSGKRLLIDFTNFQLYDLLALANSKEKIANARLDGNLALFVQDSIFSFTSDLTMNNVRFFGNNFTDQMVLEASRLQQDKFNLLLSSKSDNANFKIEGSYMTNQENSLDLNVNINALNLGTFQDFVPDIVDRLEGTLSGKLAVTGSAQKPFVNGNLNLNNTTIKPTALNTSFTFKDEDIRFLGNKLFFPHVIILDKNNNKAELYGSINFQNISNPAFDLEFNSNNFTLINTTEDDNELFYGNIVADINASITGAAKNLNVNMSTNISGNSDFTIVLPQAKKAEVAKEGVLEFIVADTVPSIMQEEASLEDTIFNDAQTNFDISANIEIEENTQISIVVDPTTKEQLNIQGSANLSFAFSSNGNLSLSGRYTIDEGDYTLTFYDVIRKKFQIREGSYLAWAGEVMDIQTDITAVYNVRTSPKALITAYTQVPDERLQEYNNRLPFNVLLNINGNLTAPEIDFDIEADDEAKGEYIVSVLNQINQNENAVNKQAFSLILFNSFLAENLTPAGDGFSLSSTARSTLSNMLTQQLNKFASQHLSGFNIELAVNSYEELSGQGRTDLDLQISKQLFNDRLVIQVGGDIALEGEEQTPAGRGNNAASIPGDVVVEYKLTPNGRYRVKIFNKTEYEELDGEVTTTGVGFLYNKEFFKLKNILPFTSVEEPESSEQADTIQ